MIRESGSDRWKRGSFFAVHSLPIEEKWTFEFLAKERVKEIERAREREFLI